MLKFKKEIPAKKGEFEVRSMDFDFAARILTIKYFDIDGTRRNVYLNHDTILKKAKDEDVENFAYLMKLLVWIGFDEPDWEGIDISVIFREEQAKEEE